jgi:hypothetical protein
MSRINRTNTEGLTEPGDASRARLGPVSPSGTGPNSTRPERVVNLAAAFPPFPKGHSVLHARLSAF